jgi:signal transduction histidine kinase/CheY-like chemotaxis protein/DNA-binding LacI/PurR family transcriptional regulator
MRPPRIGIFYGWRGPVHGALAAAEKLGLSMVSGFSRFYLARPDTLWKERPFDGYIFVTQGPEIIKEAERIYQEGYPVSILLRESLIAPTINADTRGGVVKMVDHLIALGHTRILFVTSTDDEAGRTRLQGYYDSLGKHGIPIDPDLILDLKNSETQRIIDAGLFFKKGIHFTAIAMAARWAVFVVLNTLPNFATRVPKEIALITMDNPCEFPGESEWISHCDLPSFQLGWEAVHSIHKQLQTPHRNPDHLVLPCELVVCQTCGARSTIVRQEKAAHYSISQVELENRIVQCIPTTHETQARALAREMIDLTSSPQSVADQLPRSFYQAENMGLDAQEVPGIAAELRDFALITLKEGTQRQPLINAFDKVMSQLSRHLIEISDPPFAEFPGITLIRDFFPAQTHEFVNTRDYVERFFRQISTRRVSTVILKLDNPDIGKGSVYCWERGDFSSKSSSISVVSEERIKLLTTFNGRQNRVSAITFYFDNDEGRDDWAYIECDPAETLKIDEFLKHFGAGLQTFNSYNTLKQKSLELEHAQQIAEDSHEQAEKALLRAKNASSTKNDFLSNISHEIRTPMNSIMGLTEILLESDLDRQQKNQLNMVKSSVISLLSIIDDVLDFNSIESGKLHLEHKLFFLREQLDETIRNSMIRAEKKGLDLFCRIDPSVPDRLVGDPNRLRQVLVNLIGNAIKFTNKGYLHVDVSLSTQAKDEVEVVFSVKDTGIGISPEKTDQIFNMFEQADNSITRKFGGTGLGLAISKRIIEQMGGSISVMSVEGEGSVFSFLIPFKLHQKGISQEIEIPIQNLKGKRILLIDSGFLNVEIILEYLRDWEVDVSTAESAFNATGLLWQAQSNNTPFDLILVNATLKDTSGLSFIKQLKTSNQFQGNFVIIISPTAHSNLFYSFKEMGIQTFVTKPVMQKNLAESLLEALDQSHSETDLIPIPPIEAQRKSMSILLAEDNLVNAEVVRGILEARGHHITHVDNGVDATIAYRNQHFDLVLMDVEMPKMNGLDATKLIRREDRITGKHTRILAMTARAMQGDQEKCIEAGMNGFVSKPIQKAQFILTVENETETIEFN